MADAIFGIEDLALPRERELGEPGDTRSDGENRVVGLPVLLDEAWVFGARSDQAHLALENVPELRQLIELRPGEECAQTREALILLLDERGPARSLVHLSKLQHLQLTAPASYATAPVEDAAPAFELDRRGDDDEQRRQEQEYRRGDYDVECALERAVEPRTPVGRAGVSGAKNRHASHHRAGACAPHDPNGSDTVCLRRR